MKKNFPYLVLIILPFLLFLTGSLLKYAQGYYYLYYSDPSYEYLINSLNLVQLKGYGVGHFDHPGTPVQVIGAFVLKIYSLLNNQSTEIVKNVLSDPEMYLVAINKTLIIINSLALFLLGLFTFKISQNLYLGILIQLSPFTSAQIFYGLHIVTPENFIIFVCLCFIGILIYYLFKIDINKSPPLLFIISFSAICGLGLATKLDFIPLILIPLIIIKKFKFKISFLFFTSMFFLLFVFPALSNYEYFLDWIKRLTINNGRYGYGEPTIIDFTIFFENVLKIFLKDKFFGILYLISLISLIIDKIFRLPIGFESENLIKERQLLTGIFITFTLQIILVGKHYDQHYLIPSFMISVISLILSFRLLSVALNKHLNKLTQNQIYLALILLIFSLSLFQSVSYYNELSLQKTEAIKIENYIKKNYSGSFIIPTLGGANQESALAFSTYYAGSQTSKYRNLFSQTLSSNIFYNEWTRQLYPISNKISIKDEILRRNKIILQIGAYGSDNLDEFLGELKKCCSIENPTYKKVFSNEYGESVYEIYIN